MEASAAPFLAGDLAPGFLPLPAVAFFFGAAGELATFFFGATGEFAGFFFGEAAESFEVAAFLPSPVERLALEVTMTKRPVAPWPVVCLRVPSSIPLLRACLR